MVGKIIKRLIVAFIIFIKLGATICYSTTVSGVVRSNKDKLAEVLVTDGFTFAVTDENGVYSLELSERAEFVYIVTPKGYVADYKSGVPKFYQQLEKSKNKYDFNLQKVKGTPENYILIAMADTQIDTDVDCERFEKESIVDLKQTINSYPENTQIAGIVLGDITWDVYKHNKTFKDYMKELKIPVYPVIGNHDFDKYMSPSVGADYAHIYKKDFGPLYYAVEIGDSYYIILNNIEYYGNKKYKPTLEIEDQKQWLDLLLSCVIQQNKKVFLAMHAPMKPLTSAPLIEGGEKIKKILADKFQASILSGHFHMNSNNDIGAGILEHNVGAICGTWWDGDFCRDGTPNGYKVFEAEGDKISWYYKTTGNNKDFQFKVYRKGSVMDRPDAVVVKVWNWDNQWSVRWYEDEVFMGIMDQFHSYDPDYLQHVNGRRTVGDYLPRRSNKFFSAFPKKESRELKIEVIDRFSNIYSKTIEL